MTRRGTQALGCTLFIACLGLTSLYVGLGFAGGQGSEVTAETPLTLLVCVLFPLMGLLILFHRPDHPIGWIYLAIGLSESLAFFSFAYATFESIGEPGALPDRDSWLGCRAGCGHWAWDWWRHFCFCSSPTDICPPVDGVRSPGQRVWACL